MANISSNQPERNTMISRFIIIYLLCILCVFVPLYYLFNIPDKAMAIPKLKMLDETGKPDKEMSQKIEDYKRSMKIVDSCFEKKYFGSIYRSHLDALYKISSDKLLENASLAFYFNKIWFLYESNGNLTDSLEKKVSKLNEDLNNCNKEKKDLDEKLLNCMDKLGKKGD